MIDDRNGARIVLEYLSGNVPAIFPYIFLPLHPEGRKTPQYPSPGVKGHLCVIIMRYWE
jgi:hypothetical protein